MTSQPSLLHEFQDSERCYLKKPRWITSEERHQGVMSGICIHMYTCVHPLTEYPHTSEHVYMAGWRGWGRKRKENKKIKSTFCSTPVSSLATEPSGCSFQDRGRVFTLAGSSQLFHGFCPCSSNSRGLIKRLLS